MIDVFCTAGIPKPDISVLSDEFLDAVKKSEHKKFQLELLKKLLNDEIKTQNGKNVVQARRFFERLGRTLARYQDRSIEAAQAILELIEIAKQMRDTPTRGDATGPVARGPDRLQCFEGRCSEGAILSPDKTLLFKTHGLTVEMAQGIVDDNVAKVEKRLIAFEAFVGLIDAGVSPQKALGARFYR